eukprot:7317516-Prymnesium_polylepis.1
MQPVQEDIMALLNHHGLVGDDAARALMLCSAPIDAAFAALCAAELKICPTIPTVVKHGMHRNVDGPSTIPRVTIHDAREQRARCRSRHTTLPPRPHPGGGLRPPLVPGTQPPMNVFSNTPGACYVPAQASFKSATRALPVAGFPRHLEF